MHWIGFLVCLRFLGGRLRQRIGSGCRRPVLIGDLKIGAIGEERARRLDGRFGCGAHLRMLEGHVPGLPAHVRGIDDQAIVTLGPLFLAPLGGILDRIKARQILRAYVQRIADIEVVCGDLAVAGGFGFVVGEEDAQARGGALGGVPEGLGLEIAGG